MNLPHSDLHVPQGRTLCPFRTPREGGGGEVGPDGAEGLGSGHGPHASGDFDPELTHPDHPFRFIVVEGNPQVTGEPQVVAGPFQHPGGQGGAFLVGSGAGRGGGGVWGGGGGPRLPGGAEMPPRLVAVSVTAISSRSTCAPHRPWP